MDRAGLAAGDRVIEIGCGTGQATVPLARRGLAVTAVELGAGLASVARRRLAGFAAAEVVTCAFEDWQPAGPPADAVVAGNPPPLGGPRGRDAQAPWLVGARGGRGGGRGRGGP